MKSAIPDEDEALNANEQKTPPENGKGAANPGAAVPTPAGQTATFRYVDGRSSSKLSSIRSPGCSLTDNRCALNLP
jgi:hypothetical protein